MSFCTWSNQGGCTVEVTFTIPTDPSIAALQAQLTALTKQVKVLSLQPDSPAFVSALAQWKVNMLTYGNAAAAFLADPSQDENLKKDSVYYDGTWVFLQIKDYTGDSSWQVAADNAHTYYRAYLDPNGGNVPGYWIFPHGLQLYGDIETVKLMATHSAFSGSYPLDWTASVQYSREVAYNVMAKLVAVAAGGQVWGLEEQVVQAFKHIGQWTQILNGQPVTGIPTDQPLPTYVRPFMVSLTSYALIEWAGVDAARLPLVVNTLKPIWAKLWTTCFFAQQPVQNNPGLGLVDAMMYTNVESADGTGGMQSSPDLNLMIAPVLAWLYLQTDDITWRDKHDVLFIGGVQGAYLGGGKQFNQSYQRSFQGLQWRKGQP
jgi:hypothetical protein